MRVYALSCAIYGNNDTDGVLGSTISLHATLETAQEAAKANLEDCADDLAEPLDWAEVVEGMAMWEAATADEEFTYRITAMDLQA